MRKCDTTLFGNILHNFMGSRPETRTQAMKAARCERCGTAGTLKAVSKESHHPETGVFSVLATCAVCPQSTKQRVSWKPIEPGDEVTFLGWTGRHPGKVISVYGDPGSRRRWVEVQRYRYHPRDPDAGPGHQDWVIDWDTPRSESPTKYSLRANGKWVRLGEPTKSGARIVIGYADVYYDWEF